MLFDLDGTLLDSAPDLVGALNHVRESEGLKPLPVNRLRRFVSHGAAGLLNAGMPATDEETFERWRQRFLRHYAQHSYEHSSLFDGIPEVLRALESAGKPWGIVTNKFQSLTRAVITAAGLSPTADCVVCGDTLPQSKPHPAPVLLACETIGVEPRDVLFVGDDPRDLQAGHSAGTQIAAVLYGYGEYEADDPLVKTSIAIEQPSDLLRLLGD